ncbi:MAG: BLUF domain-containing protein [Geminicoccaceae bacterium]
MNAKNVDSNVDLEAGPCFRLIYRSHSLLPDGPEGGEAGLAEILRVARSNNRGLGITGALVLYEYKQRFAQVLEGPEGDVQALYDRIKVDPRHDNVEICEAEAVPARLFNRWAMALVVEHGEPDVPMVATTGGLSEAAPWRVSAEQETILTQLRDLTRGYGRSY